jgi:hypothetical protein
MATTSAPEKGKSPALSVVQAREYRPARDELEGSLIGWQLRKPEWVGGVAANAIFRELRGSFAFSSAALELYQQTIDAAADGALPLTPQHIAARISADNSGASESELLEYLRSWSLAAPASGSEADLRRQMAYTLDLLHGLSRADRRRQADEMLRRSGIDVFDDVRDLLADGAPAATDLLSSGAFVSGFQPFDYLWDGILQRGFLYNLTGQTGAGKTAFALRFMAHVAQGRSFGGRDVEQGAVLMLAGENPDDVRMRWIALAEQASFVASEIPVTFRTGLFSIHTELPALKAQAQGIGGFALVVVDTENAFFTCDFEDENDNRSRGEWGRILRDLTSLPGRPTVLALGHPIKGTTDNLLPRGGGAYLAEIDGNLTASAENGAGKVHTQGKFRGPEFEPVPFELITVTSPQLVTKRGRNMPTVIARPLSDSEHEERLEEANTDQQRLLKAMLDDEGASLAELAIALSWRMKNGGPYKSKVQKVLGKLKGQKLVSSAAGKWSLTSSGEKAAKRTCK